MGPFPSTSDESTDHEHVTALLNLQNGNIVVAINNRPLLIWDPNSNEMVFQLEHEQITKSLIKALAQLSNGQLVTANDEGRIDIWDLEARVHLYKLDVINFGNKIIWLQVLPGDKLACFGEYIFVWDLAKLNGQPVPEDYTTSQEYRTLVNIGVTCSLFHEIKEWNRSQERKPSYLSKKFRITNYDDDGYPEDFEDVNLEMSFGVLSGGILAISYIRPGRLTIILVKTEKVVRMIEVPGDDFESCTLLPSGDAVVCRHDNKVEIYSLQDEMMYQTFRNDKGPILAIRKHPSRPYIQLVHLKDPKLPILTGESASDDCPLYDVNTCWSNDGQHIAVGSKLGHVGIWPV